MLPLDEVSRMFGSPNPFLSQGSQSHYWLITVLPLQDFEPILGILSIKRCEVRSHTYSLA